MSERWPQRVVLLDKEDPSIANKIKHASSTKENVPEINIESNAGYNYTESFGNKQYIISYAYKKITLNDLINLADDETKKRIKATKNENNAYWIYKIDSQRDLFGYYIGIKNGEEVITEYVQLKTSDITSIDASCTTDNGNWRLVSIFNNFVDNKVVGGPFYAKYYINDETISSEKRFENYYMNENTVVGAIIQDGAKKSAYNNAKDTLYDEFSPCYPIALSHDGENKNRIRTSIVDASTYQVINLSEEKVTGIEFEYLIDNIKINNKGIAETDEFLVAGTKLLKMRFGYGRNNKYSKEAKEEIFSISKDVLVVLDEDVTLKKFLPVDKLLAEPYKISNNSLRYEGADFICYNPENSYDATISLDGFTNVVFASAIKVSKFDSKNEIYKNLKKFIEKYTVVISNGNNKQPLIEKKSEHKIDSAKLDEEHFYNVISGMTPYINVFFKTKSGFKKISTLDTPFIKSIAIEDNGVKTLKLVLWDKDFGSYYSKGESLEKYIRDAIGINSVKNTGNNSPNGKDVEEGKEFIDFDYLDFKKIEKQSVDNLKIQFGYCDYNQSASEVGDKYRKVSKSQRSDRYWELEKSEPKSILDAYVFPLWNSKPGTKISEYNGDPNEKTQDVKIKWTAEQSTLDKEKEKLEDLNRARAANEISEEEYEIRYDILNSQINRYQQVINSEDSTTSSAHECNFMIVDYKTRLTENGIEYEISAIESKDYMICNYAIVQRYEDLVGTPTEVLFMLMRLFNETKEGLRTKIPVKIFWADAHDIVEEIDLEQYKKEDNAPENANQNTKNKTISISLGEQDAYYNYNVEKRKDNFIYSYKSISELLNEFCAACPPLIETKREKLTYIDSYGTTKTIDNTGDSIVRPLEWDIAEIDTDEGKEVGIFLHYRKLIKPRKIREYKWGPGNIGNTVIESLSIENANEFAVLSAVETFNKETGKIESTNKTEEDMKIDTKEDINVGNGICVNRVSPNKLSKQKTEIAYSNCLYKGKITVLGDPFYFFDDIMQPCSYPIYLNISVPISGYEISSESYSNISFADNQKDLDNGSRKHHLSGYYIVTKITHMISTSGYHTELEIMSYPGLAYEIGDPDAVAIYESLNKKIEEKAAESKKDN